jgi:hypothetical protein
MPIEWANIMAGMFRIVLYANLESTSEASGIRTEGKVRRVRDRHRFRETAIITDATAIPVSVDRKPVPATPRMRLQMPNTAHQKRSPGVLKATGLVVAVVTGCVLHTPALIHDLAMRAATGDGPLRFPIAYFEAGSMNNGIGMKFELRNARH